MNWLLVYQYYRCLLSCQGGNQNGGTTARFGGCWTVWSPALFMLQIWMRRDLMWTFRALLSHRDNPELHWHHSILIWNILKFMGTTLIKIWKLKHKWKQWQYAWGRGKGDAKAGRLGYIIWAQPFLSVLSLSIGKNHKGEEISFLDQFLGETNFILHNHGTIFLLRLELINFWHSACLSRMMF
jgi:hypothetical protein